MVLFVIMVNAERLGGMDALGETGHSQLRQTDMKKGAKFDTLLGLIEPEYRPYLPKHLEHQVGDVMDHYRRYNGLQPSMYAQRLEDFDSHEAYYLSVFVDRNRRASETATPEYKKTVEFANSLLPVETLMIMCMDGRVKLIHTNGFSAGVGSSIRTAGGMLEGFEEEEGGLTLKQTSNFARLIERKLNDNASKPFGENFDSHWTCAARIGEEQATGNNPQHDAGLYRDIQYKKRMIEATQEYMRTNHPNAKRDAIFTQTTFNPTTGYMYMGLETNRALNLAENAAADKKYAEFDKEMLKQLIEKEWIISTGELINEGLIKRAFEKCAFEADWKNNYTETAGKFWDGVSALKGELMPYLSHRILAVYPELARNSEKARKEVEHRSMLLLTNAFNTYLQNPNHDEMRYLEMDDHDYENEGNYPYGIHNEEGVKVSEGGHPPYDITMFVVYPGDADSVETAAKIVRTNRANKRVVDILGLYKDDPEGFAKSPVPVLMQEIVRENEVANVTPDQWQALRDVDWSDMPANWEEMPYKDFDYYLANEKGINSHLIAIHIHALREKMIGLYNHKSLGKHLRQLYKTVMPVIYNQDREAQAVIPFVKVGRASYRNGVYASK